MNRYLSSLIVLLVFAASITVTSCHKEDPEQPGPNEVWLEYQLFRPSELVVAPGTTVNFINKGNPSHVLYSSLFTSPRISTDETYSYTFTTAGVYYFTCASHSSITSEQVAIRVQ
jgi:plastocyanin